jgi:putative RecB family exonuclease
MFEQCPRRYKFRYVEKFDAGDRVSIESFLGGRVHEALERLYELVMYGKLWSEQELLDFYDKIWENQKPLDLAIRDEDLDEEHFREKGRRMLSDYYREYHPFDQDRTVALERNVVVNLDEDGKYRIRGIIDRLAVKADGTMVVCDYKTARSMVSQTNLDEDRQLALYQLAVQQLWPDRDRYELVWHYLAIPEKRTSERTDADLDRLVDETIRLIREIEQAQLDDNFPTKESRLCNWCEYMSFCPAKIHQLQAVDKQTGELHDDEVIRAIDRLVEIKGQMASFVDEERTIKKQLADFAERNGLTVLSGTGKNVGIRFSSQYRPKFSKMTAGKEEERKKFIDFLIETGMMELVFSYNAQGFNSFVTKAKYNPEHRDRLFDMIKFVEQAPVVTVRNKTD